MTKKEYLEMQARINEMKMRMLDSADSGLKGKVAELETCLYCNVYRMKPQPKNKRDLSLYNGTRSHRYNIELKTGGGELKTLDSEGNTVTSIESNHYIAWCPRYDVTKGVEQLRVFKASEFIPMLAEKKQVRLKESSNKPGYFDRITIQSYDPKPGKENCGRNKTLYEIYYKGVPFNEFYETMKAQ